MTRSSSFPASPLVLSFVAALVAASAAAGVFKPVSELDPALLMPPDSEKVEIAPDGNFLVNGKPRYLLGTILYHTPSLDECAHGEGYADEDAWIYETIPDRDYLQRLGFDTVGGEVSTTWMTEFRPDRSFYQARRKNDWSLAARYWKSGLPTIVDFTCAGWSHGALRFQEGQEPAADAFAPGGHFMPYSLVTPEGRDLYARMWRSGAEELKAHDVHPYAYELFNEPSYDDRTPAARIMFAKFLDNQWRGDPAAMDRAWGSSYGSFRAAATFKHPNECIGLGVAWMKFREICFAEGIRLGLETIREVDPDARVCFQPLGISFGYVNMFRANRTCGVVMSPTGGRDAFDTMLLRAIADGKPIVDGETYFGRTRASHRAMVLTQWSRGINASYYFKWERRLWDPAMKEENGLVRLAEKFPWLALNPAYTPAEALAGLMDAKRDIAAMEDLFGPRDHGIPTKERIAVLYSLPTERLGVVAGHGNHTFTKANAMALANGAHLVVDAIFEEQILEGRLNNYRVLVAAGVDATYPETIPAIRRWVEAGGMLILSQEAMQLDELARPREGNDFPGIALGEPCHGEASRHGYRGQIWEAVPYREVDFGADRGDWRTLTPLPDGHCAVYERTVGRGLVYYIGARFPNAGDEGRLIYSLAACLGVYQTCATLDPETGSPVDDIEVQAARGKNGVVGFVVVNRGLGARAVRFHAKGVDKVELVPRDVQRGDSNAESADFAVSVTRPNLVLRDVTRGVKLGRDAEGAVLLLLEPGVPVVLRSVEKDSELPEETYADTLAKLPAWLAAHQPKAEAKAFSVDPERVRFLDLREVANRSFLDAVAGDEKGGWTDQGENCLRHVPWGPTDCNGVPFDFIRPDQNEDRACVILRSTHQPYLPEAVRGIAANLRAEALYFLHAGAWLGSGEAFRYVVRYADGSAETLPMVPKRDFGDWWIDGRSPGNSKGRYRTGWTNSERKGFHVLRWDNPHPEKTIATIDIESANSGTIPIIAAITAELPDESPFALWRLRCSGWGGVSPERRDGGIELALTDQTKDWAGANLRPPKPVPLPGAADGLDLVFEVNGGRTPLGSRHVGGQPFQVSATFRLADGSTKSGAYIGPKIEGGSVDDDPWSWQTVRLPLRRLLPKTNSAATAVTGVSVQYRVLPANRAGLLVRAIRLEAQAAQK